MTDTDLKLLDDWLYHHQIPVITSNPRTLMDIMGIRKLENPWSDLYAFFMSEREEHELGDIFIRSLEKILKLPVGWITPTSIEREFVTSEDKRIDILLTDDIHERAIIIENKVFHAPINPFSEYIETIQGRGYKEIKVVILAPYKVTEAYKAKFENLRGIDYVGITHEEYMQEVQRRIALENNRGNVFYRQILDHFIQNIKNLSNMVSSEQLDFFYTHFHELHAINDLFLSIERSYNEVLQGMELGDYAEVEVDKKFHSNSENSWLYLPYKNTNNAVCLTVFFLPNQQLRVILEIRGKNVIQKINTVELHKLIDSVKEVQHEGLAKDQKEYWWHVAEFYSRSGLDLNPIKLRSILQEVINSPIYELGKSVVKLLK